MDTEKGDASSGGGGGSPASGEKLFHLLNNPEHGVGNLLPDADGFVRLRPDEYAALIDAARRFAATAMRAPKIPTREELEAEGDSWREEES